MSSDPNVPPDQPPPGGQPVPPPASKHAKPPQQAVPPKSAVGFTKTAAAWWALIVGIFLLIILLVFIGQNTDSVDVRFLGWTWQAPKGIAFLVAAIGGALITILTGTARMVQLRLAAKRNLRKR